jgi:DNA-binding transcriptional ArsR family regulator
MENWQASEGVVQLKLPEGVRTLLRTAKIERVEFLTVRQAREIVRRRPASPHLLLASDADSDALAVLRGRRMSYVVEKTNEAFIAPAPDVVVDWPPVPKPTRPAFRNPFAPRASRVPRWLLLHHRETFTVRELSNLVDVDESLVSRTIASLRADGFVDAERNPDDERIKPVRLVAADALLDEWRLVWRRGHPRYERFSIGTKNVGETLNAVRDAAEVGTPYAISGLAGAASIRRAVDPSDVLLLTNRVGAQRWRSLLLAEPSDRGLLQIAVAPDEFVFTLCKPWEGLLVADAVQLWLDTAIAGERAQAATRAITKAMSWSRS